MKALKKLIPDRKRIASRLLRVIGKAIIMVPGTFTRYDHDDTAKKLYELSAQAGDTSKSTAGIVALFHGPHFPIIHYGRNHNLVVITSRSKDGQILTDILHQLGYDTVRGSSGRKHGGMSVIRDLTRKLNNGQSVVIAVDGPRGPILEVKEGILILAKLTGRPIFPVGICAKRFYRFQSWDRFRLPIPFSKVWIRHRQPIVIPRDCSNEELAIHQKQLQEKLFEVQKEADELASPVVYARKDRKPRDGGKYPILETRMGLKQDQD